MKPLPTLLLAFLLNSLCAHSAELIDDRQITISSPREVTEKRTALIQYLWGAEGFPQKLPTVISNIPTPVKGLTNLARVDEFRFDLATNLQSIAWHFVPKKANRQLVVVHHGHACTLDDDPSPNDVGYGLQRTINALLREGYGVLGVFMPHMRPGDCTGGHDALVQAKTIGSSIKYFLEPTAISLNYLKTHSRSHAFPNYRAFHMTGLSGGGWTATIYAAIDPRIQCSIPIAGSIPLYLRTGSSIGDLEQFDPALYTITGYPDLYLLGSHGQNRRQVQILLQKDDCCFGAAQHDAVKFGQPYAEAMREYETRVQQFLKKSGPGEFHLEIDGTAPTHMISHHAIEEILLPTLRKSQSR